MQNKQGLQMKPRLYQRTLSHTAKRRRLIQSVTQETKMTIEPLDLWKVYRPLQGYLDMLGPEQRAQQLQTSRESLLRALQSRFESDVLELRGDTLHPLKLVLG